MSQITKKSSETKKIAKDFAKDLKPQEKATVLGLKGDLGAGKTTFIQGIAEGLGIKEKVLSPTFVIMKRFKIPREDFDNFYHIDCYRIKNEKDIEELNFKEIIKNPKNIIAIEWPERIKKALPKNTKFLEFKFIDQNTREIAF